MSGFLTMTARRCSKNGRNIREPHFGINAVMLASGKKGVEHGRPLRRFEAAGRRWFYRDKISAAVIKYFVFLF